MAFVNWLSIQKKIDPSLKLYFDMRSRNLKMKMKINQQTKKQNKKFLKPSGEITEDSMTLTLERISSSGTSIIIQGKRLIKWRIPKLKNST